jgi:xanthine dehydrogenase YagS FAD-binding subunit
MKAFEYYKVKSVKDAVSLLAKYGEKAAILAGGSDLLGIMKDCLEGPKLKMPQHLIDIKEIKDLNYIKDRKGSLKIGAATTLSEIAASDLIGAKHPLLVQTAAQVGVPQIRNVGTLAGNLCQRPRCWYFRRSLFQDCLRKGGSTCYALDGENQYHAIIGGSGCCMVYPSDMAPALIALNAGVEIAGPKGNRILPLEQFYTRPEKNVLKENILTPQEMVVAVDIPKPSVGRGVYLKMKERQAFDFAIVSVAVNLILKNNVIADSRIVFGGLAPFPFRSVKAEAVLKGKQVREAMAASSRQATEGAAALSGNAIRLWRRKASWKKRWLL